MNNRLPVESDATVEGWFDDMGGFVAHLCDTSVAVYAYPTSEHAHLARKHPIEASQSMIHQEMEHASFIVDRMGYPWLRERAEVMLSSRRPVSCITTSKLWKGI